MQLKLQLITFIVISLPIVEVNSLRTIKVVASSAEPFKFFKNGKQTLDGLDMKIVDNFGKKFNLRRIE